LSTWVWIVIVAAVAVIVLAAVWWTARGRRTERLREGFGTEYDRTVERAGDRSAAEADLLERQRRHDELDLHPLDPATRQRLIDDWKGTQAAFVDDPAVSIRDADLLIQRAMRERGYPVDDFDERAAIVSVDHPQVVERYRRAHGVAEASSAGAASTESLRLAIQDYRALFVEIVETPAEVTR
jgi:hypothetical protein